MAFVLVQHLDPKHHSLLTELVSKKTSMTLKEVTDGMVLEPNHDLAAWTALNALGERELLIHGSVAQQIAEREFLRGLGPLHFFGRKAARDAHDAFANTGEIFQVWGNRADFHGKLAVWDGYQADAMTPVGANAKGSKRWSGRGDLNSRPPAPKTNSKTLSSCLVYVFRASYITVCAGFRPSLFPICSQRGRHPARCRMPRLSLGCHAGNNLTAVAAIDAEILVGRQDHGIGNGFSYPNEARIGKTHGNVGVFLN